MSDTVYDTYQHYGTNAQRLAFTPAPPSGAQPIYIWYETDTNLTYIYTTGWKGPFTGGGGNGIITGTPITISNAATLTLPTTPVTLVPAAATNTRNKILFVTIRSILATAYTNINSTYAAFQITYHGDTTWITIPIVNDSTVSGMTYFGTLFSGAAHDLIVDLPEYTDSPNAGGTSPIAPNIQYVRSANPIGVTVARAKAIDISIDNNGSGNLTGGGAGNSIVAIPYYVNESIP